MMKMRYHYSKVTTLRKSHLPVTCKKSANGVGSGNNSDTAYVPMQLKKWGISNKLGANKVKLSRTRIEDCHSSPFTIQAFTISPI
jgi:hypothetical protein